MKAETLPFEILERVNQNLSAYDRLNCLLVCKSWYEFFSLSFYSTISICGHPGPFIDQLRRSAHTQSPVGHIVQNLYLKDPRRQDHTALLKELSTLCPNLRSLSMDSALWDLILQEKDPECTPLTSIKRFVGPFGPGSSLISLSLMTCKKFSHILPVLQYTSQLTSLQLSAFGEFYLHDLRTINTYCCQLGSLELEGIFPRTKTANIEQNAASINIYKRMQTLKIRFFHHWDRPDTWIHYFARVYPNLEHLHLRHQSIPQDVEPPNTSDWRLGESVKQLKLGCQRLKTVEIIDLYLCHMLLAPLLHSDPKVDIDTLNVSYHPDNDRGVFNALSQGGWSNLRRMEICSRLAYVHDVIPALSALRLEELTLSPDSNSIEIRILDFLNSILDACPHLKILTLIDTSTASQEAGKAVRSQLSHGLRSLILHKVCLHQSVLDVLSVRCQKLRHLAITECVQYSEYMSIYLPSNRMDTIDLQNFPRREERQHSYPMSSLGPAAPLYRVSQGSNVEWFEAGKIELTDGNQAQPSSLEVSVRKSTRIAQAVDEEHVRRFRNGVEFTLRSVLARMTTKKSQADLWLPHLSIVCESLANFYVDGKRIPLSTQ
ncbi:hypothetical protein EC973_002518 [Apophysomyces ossiformis]|uniref:F-box domain-containing protein n=1 Tax=Apophysomyces ossiformis TaxID=679940 RepID=A0A8H7BW81_9FUNG|nr:hypothetical protein EC973_002518 [Apophysomyces ossiformis]